tara:strand:+ start:31376 stop:32332 length:957 start_codon:yes stop_codon:yes gene_type:complete
MQVTGVVNNNKWVPILFFLLLAVGCLETQTSSENKLNVTILSGHIVETESLSSLINQPHVVLVDAREEEKYTKFHLPNSVNIPKNLFRTSKDIKFKNANGFAIPSEKAEKIFGEAGIGKITRVIVYDSVTFPDASIIWGLLKYYGHDNVQILKGGFEKWVSEGRPVTSEPIKDVKKAIFKAVPKPEMVATAKWIMENKDEIVIIDLRSFKEYLGLNKAGNIRGGSIPGAVNIEWKELAGDTTIKSAERIGEVLAKYGIPKNKEIVTYCNIGIGRSTYGLFLLKMLGYEKARVYGGSMEDWSGRLETPMGDMKNIPAKI